MAALELTPIALPLRADETGTVRVGGTRVTLDTVVAAYGDGSSAEEIAEQFPGLGLAEVHAAVAFYLTHRAEVEVYLTERQCNAAEVRRQVEGVCDQRGIRERLLARKGLGNSAP